MRIRHMRTCDKRPVAVRDCAGYGNTPSPTSPRPTVPTMPPWYTAGVADKISSMKVDIQGYRNRHGMKDRLRRFLWRIVWLTLFRPTPRILFRWRVFLLRCFGAKIGRCCPIYPSCKIRAPWKMELGDFTTLASEVDFYNVDLITIGSNTTVSQGAFICTASHDISDPHMELITSPIRIGSSAWIAANAFVGPGVTIGEGAVAGACSVVFKDVAPWTVVAGNPARIIKQRVMREG